MNVDSFAKKKQNIFRADAVIIVSKVIVTHKKLVCSGNSEFILNWCKLTITNTREITFSHFEATYNVLAKRRESKKKPDN